MNPTDASTADAIPRRIELNLSELGQLFNTMDPSPFHQKDLDHDAEEFILSWAEEFPAEDPLELVVHLTQPHAGEDPQRLVEQAVHNYFGYRARLNRMEFARLMKVGRRSLLIGLMFLASCLIAGQALGQIASGTLLNVMREGLTIGGWVAMWRPLEIYLYDWWPVRRRGRIFNKLSCLPVQVRQPAVPSR